MEIICFPQDAQRPADVGYAPTGAEAEKPPAGRNAPLHVVYSCALFQRGKPRLAALKAIIAVSGLVLLLILWGFCKYFFYKLSVVASVEQQL